MSRAWAALLLAAWLALLACSHATKQVAECERRYPGCTLWPAYRLTRVEVEARNGSQLARWKEEWDASEASDSPYSVRTASAALLELKALVLDDPWGFTDAWTPGQHPCDWPQVLCNQHGVVTGADLAGPAPEIPAFIAADEPGMDGGYTPGKAALPCLGLRQLPQGPAWAALGRMSLRTLRLDNARLEDAALPAAWAEQPHLRELSLTGCGLSGRLPPAWGGLARLRSLLLADNALTGPLPPAWAGMESLRTLDASLRGLGGPQQARLAGSLPADWRFLGRLRVLDLWNQGITGSLPPEWGELPALEVVSLSGTRLTGSLPPAWGAAGNLTTVALAGTGVGGRLPASWGAALNLTWVDLRGTSVARPLPAAWRAFCRGKKAGGRFPSAAYLPWNGGEVLSSVPRPGERSGCPSWLDRLPWLAGAVGGLAAGALAVAALCRRQRGSKLPGLKRS